MRIKKIAIYSLIAALYAVLSLMMGSFSFVGIQFRIGELLMIFCIFNKKFILPLTFGCFITNLIGILMGINNMPFDLLIGTLATLLSGILMNKLSNIQFMNRPLLSLIMPALVNGIFIGIELALYLGNSENFFVIFITNGLWIFVGEFISVFILGLIFYKQFEKLSKDLEM